MLSSSPAERSSSQGGLAVAAALAALLGAAPAAPAAVHAIGIGPQVTCVTHPSVCCAGDQTFQTPADPSILESAVQVAFGLRHGCLLAPDGTARCWGDGTQGQLGVAASEISERCLGRPCRRSPDIVPEAPALTALTAGWLHTCGLTTTRDVVCWGDDSLDQIGRSTPGPAAAPVEGLTGEITAVAAGGVHTCALRDDGSVACWGDGSSGQLGQGKAEDSPTAVEVTGLAGPVRALAAGGYHTCAVLADGSVACWGANRFGQLGDGTRNLSSSAVPVGGLAGPARSVATGATFSCALLASGAVQCWGSNEMGELGIGRDSPPPRSGEPPSPPVAVRGLGRGVVALWAGGSHACAEMDDGSLRCWGANEVGQLGDGTVAGRPAPIAWLGRVATLPRPARRAETASGALRGLDVSYHSGRVDWQRAVAAGHHFGLTLATAGIDFRDPYLAAHWERMRQVGLVRGAYHYFVAGDDPEVQARALLSQVLFQPGDLLPVVDIETLGMNAPHDLPARLRTFLEALEHAIGAKPIIYTSPRFWDRNMDGDFGAYPLWIAEYGVAAPRIPTGWKRWHIWQWRGNADLPEIAPTVDLDRSHPEIALEDLVIPESPPTPRTTGGR